MLHFPILLHSEHHNKVGIILIALSHGLHTKDSNILCIILTVIEYFKSV